MSAVTMKNVTSMGRLLATVATAAPLMLTAAAHAAAPGITGTGTAGTFALTAQPAYLSQPDGQAVYSWGYGCAASPAPGQFVPATITTGSCGSMQVPGPTLVVTENQPVTITLTNNLPTSTGNSSILFPGFQVPATGGVAGPWTQVTAPGATAPH